MKPVSLRGAVPALAYSSVFLTSGIFSAYNVAWLVEKGFTVPEVTVIQALTLVFSAIFPPLLMPYLTRFPIKLAIAFLVGLTAVMYALSWVTEEATLIVLFVAIAYFFWSLLMPLNEVGAAADTGNTPKSYSGFRVYAALAGTVGGLIFTALAFVVEGSPYVPSLLACYLILLVLNALRPKVEPPATEEKKEDKSKPKKESPLDNRLTILLYGCPIGLFHVLYLHYSVLYSDGSTLLGIDRTYFVWNVAFVAELLTFIALYKRPALLDHLGSLKSCLAVAATSFLFLYASIAFASFDILLSVIGMTLFGVGYSATSVAAFKAVVQNVGNEGAGFAMFYSFSGGILPLSIYAISFVLPEQLYPWLMVCSGFALALLFVAQYFKRTRRLLA